MAVEFGQLGPIHNRRVAQGWALLGCEVIPWRYRATSSRRRKVPGIRGWTRGEAFKTPAEVGQFWQYAQEEFYPGIVTGERSGIWVLDIDGEEGIANIKALVAANGPLPPEALRVKTPSGGWHYYFGWVDGIRNSASVIANKIDVRGQGGYVAAPGAVVQGGAYSCPEHLDWPPPLAPDWLTELALSASTRSSSTLIWDGEYTDEVRTVDDLASVGDGKQEAALSAFLRRLHREGIRPDVALQYGWEAAQRFEVFDSEDPWTYEDVQYKVEHTWSRTEYAGVSKPLDLDLIEKAKQLAVPSANGSGVPTTTVVAAEPVVIPASPEVRARELAEDNLLLGDAPHDRANARALAHFAADRLRVVGEKRWLVWDGRRWVLDEKFARYGIVEELGQHLLMQASVARESEREALIKRSNRLMMVGGRDATFNYAKDLLAVSSSELDPDQYVINCRNGLLDLRTGVLRPAVPADLVTKLVDVDYVPGATDAVWEKVLADLLPLEGDQLWLQKWFGYCLTGDVTEKAICCLHGPADSGKSTIAETFRLVLGDVQAGGYSQTWENEVFVSRSNVNRAEKVAGLMNARLVIGSELPEGAHLAAAFVKSVTGGEAQAARALFENSIVVTPRLKLMMHTNHLLRTGDLALQKRLRFVYLDRALTHEEKDPTIKLHLETDDGARRAVLAWAVAGARRWFVERLGMPARQEEELATFRRESDHLVEFVEDALEGSAGNSAEVQALWPDKMVLRAAYEGWCAETGYTPVKPMTLKQGLENQGLVFGRIVRDGRQVNVWHNVKISWQPDMAALSGRVTTESD